MFVASLALRMARPWPIDQRANLVFK